MTSTLQSVTSWYLPTVNLRLTIAAVNWFSLLAPGKNEPIRGLCDRTFSCCPAVYAVQSVSPGTRVAYGPRGAVCTTVPRTSCGHHTVIWRL